MNIKQITKQFSVKEKGKIYSLKRDKDKIASSVGKLLLYYMLNKIESQPYMKFPNFEYTNEGRPYFKNKKYDFNISHAHNIVACVICFRGMIGIDVEQICKLDLTEYRSILTEKEYLFLQNSDNEKEEFIKLWTIKEAVLKADGRGFLAGIKNLSVMNNISTLDNQIWYNYSCRIREKYYLSIATSHSMQPIISEMNISQLINEYNV